MPGSLNGWHASARATTPCGDHATLRAPARAGDDGARTSGAVVAVQWELRISQPAKSQHLLVLRENGFATVRAEGTRRLCSVDSTPLQEVDLWLERSAGS